MYDVMIAVSVRDLNRSPECRTRLLAGRLDLSELVFDASGCSSVDLPAVAFSCDVAVACAVVDLIVSWDVAVGDRPTRSFVSTDSGAKWRCVPDRTKLAVVGEGDAVTINSELLPAPQVATTPMDDSHADAIPISMSDEEVDVARTVIHAAD